VGFPFSYFTFLSFFFNIFVISYYLVLMISNTITWLIRHQICKIKLQLLNEKKIKSMKTKDMNEKKSSIKKYKYKWKNIKIRSGTMLM